MLSSPSLLPLSEINILEPRSQPGKQSSWPPEGGANWLQAGELQCSYLLEGKSDFKNVSLLYILSLQNIFPQNNIQSRSAHPHNDFAIFLTDHSSGNGTSFSCYFANILPMFLFPFTNQKCLLFNTKLFLTKKRSLAIPEINFSRLVSYP